MIVNVPTSLGDLIDKISILLIKKNKMHEKRKLAYVNTELNKLKLVLDSTKIKKSKIKPYINKLKDINLKLWNIEDRIRECEKNNIFNNKFIQLARSIYMFNDQRAKIKLSINNKFGSTIVEVKSYQDY